MVLVSYPSRGIQGGILGLGDKKNWAAACGPVRFLNCASLLFFFGRHICPLFLRFMRFRVYHRERKIKNGLAFAGPSN
jgi:hypothetical protein